MAVILMINLRLAESILKELYNAGSKTRNSPNREVSHFTDEKTETQNS